MEKQLNRPLQWLVCLLHGNELPLRHLINHLDTGPIGKLLVNCEKLDVVRYAVIDSDIPVILKEDLNTDQKYYVCSEDLSKRNPGNTFAMAVDCESDSSTVHSNNYAIKAFKRIGNIFNGRLFTQ